MTLRRPDPEAGFSLGRTLAYSAGSLGTGVFSTVPSVLLLYFCTQILGISAAAAALVVFLPKAWSIVWDPFVGTWSDRTRTAIGRRRPFLLAGAIGVSLSFLGLFAAPYDQPTHKVATVAILYFLLATTYSLFAVPYVAVPAEVSDVRTVREKLTAWRIALGMVGVLVGAALAPLLVAASGGGRHGYAVMGLIVAVICGAGMFSAFLATPSTFTGGAPGRRGAAVADAWLALGNRQFRTLLLSYVLQLTAMGVFNAMTPYWIVFVLGRGEGDVGLALGILLLATILTTPLWARAIAKLGAQRCIALAVGLYTASVLSLLGATHLGADAIRLAAFLAIGVAFAGLQVAPFSLVAHLVHSHAATTRKDQQGLMMGLWTAGEKLGLALGAGAAGAGLAAVGFASGQPDQTAQAIQGVGWLIALGPAMFAVLSLPLVYSLRARAEPSGKVLVGSEPMP